MKKIPTSKGKYTIVDDEDYEWLNKFRWYENQGYAVTKETLESGKVRTIQMHRLIMNPPPDKQVDHINRKRNDNRKDNLRIATKSQNMRNKGKQEKPLTSIYKGVCILRGKYYVHIGYDDKQEHIGVFSNEIAAANAYNYYAKLYFSEFACLNDVEFMEKEKWQKFKSVYSSVYKGVSWNKEIKKWEAYTHDGKTKNRLGYFENEIVAANYYNHLTKSKINECDYISLEECEAQKYTPMESSKYKGVSWLKKYGKWIVTICHNKKSIYVGHYENEIEAALAYNCKVKELNLNKKLNKIEGE